MSDNLSALLFQKDDNTHLGYELIRRKIHLHIAKNKKDAFEEILRHPELDIAIINIPDVSDEDIVEFIRVSPNMEVIVLKTPGDLENIDLIIKRMVRHLVKNFFIIAQEYGDFPINPYYADFESLFMKLAERTEFLHEDEIDKIISKVSDLTTENMNSHLAYFIARLGRSKYYHYVFTMLRGDFTHNRDQARQALRSILTREVPYEEVMDLKELILDLVDLDGDAEQILAREEWFQHLAEVEDDYLSGRRREPVAAASNMTAGPDGGYIVSDGPVTQDQLDSLSQLPFVGFVPYPGGDDQHN